mgnify:CR=1 FL=1
MQYKILASDYDNTLVPFGENQPRPATVKAVKKLQAAGGKFVLSTGRSWPAINRKGQLGGIRFDYAITCNGACVVDKNGASVAEHPMTNEEMYALVDFCEDYDYPLQFNFRDAYYAYCEYETLRSCYAQMNSVGLDCVDGEDQDRHLIDMPHAAFCIFPEGALEPLYSSAASDVYKRQRWNSSMQNTATSAFTSCRWAASGPTAPTSMTSCGAGSTRARASQTSAKRWASPSPRPWRQATPPTMWGC